jgi:hypothetical protein
VNDLDSLLADHAHPAVTQPAPDHVVDADIARGRRALRRERVRRGGAGALLAAALAVAGLTVANVAVDGTGTDVIAVDGAPAAPAPAPPPGSAAGGAAQGGTGPVVQLVSYTGEQPAGFTVGSVPAGWEVQGVDEAALVIARQGDPDRSLDSYESKLVVLLQSQDEPDWTPESFCAEQPDCDVATTAVGATTALVVHEPSGVRLFVTDADGQRLAIQAPAALGWSDAEIAAFAATVQATPAAVAGQG